MTRKQKVFALVCIDSLFILIASVLAELFLEPIAKMNSTFMIGAIIAEIILYIIIASILKIFNRMNRHSSLKTIMAIIVAITGTYAVIYLGMLFFVDVPFSKRYVVLSYLFSVIFIVTSRLVWRAVNDISFINSRKSEGTKTLIVGAGAAGRILANSIDHTPEGGICVAGFVDDDLDKQGTYYNGHKVLGTTKDLPAVIKEHDIKVVNIAIPSIKKEAYQRIIESISDLGVKITSLPFLEELANGQISVSKLKEIDVVDVLGRDEIKLDMAQIADDINGKTILITGAGGSIGSELTRQLMKFTPKRILLLGHGENSIYQIHRELKTKYKDKNTDFVPIIADIQDRARIDDVMKEYHPQIIYHAAAHKHVPMMQCNPTEAVKNNIFGTKNVAELAKINNVEKFVMISTDKAVNPPNVMGATKRIAEMIVTGLNEPGKTKFVAVRFGNVLGSRGSVIPLFKEQIAKGGPVTVTDFRMTRYFMTIPEASRLVIQAGALAQGGEIFILDMGEPVKIVDLAKKMIQLSGYKPNEIEIVESGIRPGEKLYEVLLVDKEKNPKQVHEKIFSGSVHGFPLDKIESFITQLPTQDEKLLTEELLTFARESSK